MSNPFRSLLLPLAYQHFGVLQALLGLALCHSEKGRKHSKYGAMPLALELKLSAIHSLSELLLREQCPGLTADEEEAAMAMALLLILHDVSSPNGLATVVYIANEHPDYRVGYLNTRCTSQWSDILLFEICGEFQRYEVAPESINVDGVRVVTSPPMQGV